MIARELPQVRRLKPDLVTILIGVNDLVRDRTADAYRASLVTIYESALEAVSDGVRTADLGGEASTTEFTDEVIRRVRTKVDVWSALADVER